MICTVFIASVPSLIDFQNSFPKYGQIAFLIYFLSVTQNYLNLESYIYSGGKLPLTSVGILIALCVWSLSVFLWSLLHLWLCFCYY